MRNGEFDNENKEFLANYDEWLKEGNLQNISKEDALFLFIGYEPKYARRYKDICKKYNINTKATNTQANHNKKWRDEEKFFREFDNEDSSFYKIYTDFINWLNIDKINTISTDNINYEKGGFFTFVQHLYNNGYVPCDALDNYLKKIDKKLEYSKGSKVYKLFDKYRKRPFWSLEDLRCLVCGMDPETGCGAEKEALVIFFNNQSKNRGYFTNTKLSTSSMLYTNPKKDGLVKFGIKLKNRSALDDYEEYLNGLDIDKKGNYYNAKDLLQNIIDDTAIEPPKLLIMMVLGQSGKGKSKSKEKPEKTGRISNFNKMASGIKNNHIDKEKMWEYLFSMAREENQDFKHTHSFVNFKIAQDKIIETIRWSTYNSKDAETGDTMSRKTFFKKYLEY